MNLANEEKRTDGGELAGWASFEGKVDVLLAYRTRKDMQKIIKKSTKTTYVNHQPKQDLDDDKLYEALADCVLNWNLTLGVVATMVPIKLDPAREEEAVPCTRENVLFLLKEAYYFDGFVREASTDLSMLKEEQEEKN